MLCGLSLYVHPTVITGRPFHGRACAYRRAPARQVIEVRAEAAYTEAAGLMEQLSLSRS